MRDWAVEAPPGSKVRGVLWDPQTPEEAWEGLVSDGRFPDASVVLFSSWPVRSVSHLAAFPPVEESQVPRAECACFQPSMDSRRTLPQPPLRALLSTLPLPKL